LKINLVKYIHGPVAQWVLHAVRTIRQWRIRKSRSSRDGGSRIKC